MYKYGLANLRHMAVTTLFIIVSMVIGVTVTVRSAYAEDEAMEVTCYKGDLQEGNNVGNVTVTNAADAGPTCNSTYYDCDGKCVGCYFDQNLGKMVCFDNTGENVDK